MASPQIGKFSLAFFPGKNRRDPNGNSLDNILVIVKINPDQIKALSPSHEEKLRYFTIQSVSILFAYTLVKLPSKLKNLYIKCYILSSIENGKIFAK